MANLLKILNKALKGNYQYKKIDNDEFSITFNIYATPITIYVSHSTTEDRINAYETDVNHFYNLKFRKIIQNIEWKDYNAIKEWCLFDEEKKKKDEDDFYNELFKRYLSTENLDEKDLD